MGAEKFGFSLNHCYGSICNKVDKQSDEKSLPCSMEEESYRVGAAVVANKHVEFD